MYVINRIVDYIPQWKIPVTAGPINPNFEKTSKLDLGLFFQNCPQSHAIANTNIYFTYTITISWILSHNPTRVISPAIERRIVLLVASTQSDLIFSSNLLHKKMINIRNPS